MENNLTIEEKLVALLRDKKMTVTTAESCTGGMISATLVNVPGASWVLNEAYVTYSNEAKLRLLGVSRATLDTVGAVSEETAYQMAQGAAKAANADCAISVTGIAGPDGGTHDKPVGTVYAGFYVRGNIWVVRYLFDGDRLTVRKKTVQSVLEELFSYIENICSS